jgi:enoyl-[acyl-carrier protein] reductase II
LVLEEDFMLKTRITEQYGLKVPFINAGMAFIATPPLVRAVCSAGGMGMLGGAAMPPDVLQAAIRDIKAVDPASYGVTIIARFSGIEHIEVCVAEKVPVVVFFWDDPPDDWLSRLRAAGSHIWFQVGSVAEARAARRRWRPSARRARQRGWRPQPSRRGNILVAPGCD